MLALCKVHAAGVLHNTPLHLRHFVMKGKKVFLIDFALAMVHQCENAHPVLLNQALRPAAVTEDCRSECGELIVAERNIFLQIGEQLPIKINPSLGLTTVVL
jgi:tRNA A-37 threonylcarbamoyl transferase component Bud32